MRLDIPLNLITLCSGHHRKAENRDITQTELFDVLGDTYNYDYEQFIDLYREYIRS